MAVFALSCYAADINLWIDDASGVIGTVDVTPGPNLGKVTIIGPSGVILTDIAFSPGGALYGIGPNVANPPYSLFSLNTGNGAASTIGALSPTINALPCALGTCPPNSLVFSPGGTLYTAVGGLYTINPTTASDLLVGSLGSGFVSGGDLAFADGNLYLTTADARLVTVNTATGAATLVGPTGVANLFGLASPDGTTLYGVGGTSVYTVSKTTGAATLLVDYGGQGLGQAFGEAFITESGPSVPEPSSFLLVAAASISLLYRRRRKLPKMR